MTPSLALGLILNLLAGLMAGNCMLPLKFNRAWKWENSWLIFSIVSLVILPWILALWLVDHLFEIYAGLSPAQFALPFLFGAGWGVAQVMFGLSVARLGLGLAYAIIVGLGAVLGTLVPLFAQHRAELSGTSILEILGGILLMTAGMGLSAWGGRIRERNGGSASSSKSGHGYLGAILLAIACGVLAPMLNYAFAFGQDIALQAASQGNTIVRSGYAVWPIGLAGGFLPNLLYSLYLLGKRKSWHLFQAPTPDSAWSVLMGVLWMGSMALYGMSAVYLGHLGTSIGWGLFQIFMIATATLSGVITGEWKSAPRAARLLLVTGLGCLTGATTLLALGSR